MNYFYFDNPEDKKKMSFLNENETIKLIFPPHKLGNDKGLIKYCKQIIKDTNENDKLIFWYDFMGVIAWWCAMLMHKKRNIIIVNILLKTKKTIKNRVARFLYKKVLRDTKTIVTFTSKEYGEYIIKLLSCKRNIIVLNDLYKVNATPTIEEGEYIFCGGRNGRDWEKMIGISQEMRDYKFHFVLPKGMYEKYKEKFPSNVVAKYDISNSEFYEELKKSKMVVMPLDTEAPAGLIVMFQACECNRLVITSNTLTTREYFGKNSEVLCGNDVKDWITRIKKFSSDDNLKNESIKEFSDFLNNNCSEEIYSKKIIDIISRGE